MRPSRFTDEEITQALSRVAKGTPAVDVCRSLGITETTFYRWRKKHDAEASDAGREVRELRGENEELKHIVADLLLEKKRWITSKGRR
ncbi:MAG: transposase [bacterium]